MSSFLSSLYILENSSLSDVGLVKIFSYSVGCRFVLLTMFFALQKLFSFMKSHLLLILVSLPLVFYLGSCLLCQYIKDYPPLFFLSDSVYLVLCWGLWCIWTWVLCRMIDYILLHADIQLCQHHFKTQQYHFWVYSQRMFNHIMRIFIQLC